MLFAISPPHIYRLLVTTRALRGVLFPSDKILFPVPVDAGETVSLEVALAVAFKHANTTVFTAIKGDESDVWRIHGSEGKISSWIHNRKRSRVG